MRAAVLTRERRALIVEGECTAVVHSFDVGDPERLDRHSIARGNGDPPTLAVARPREEVFRRERDHLYGVGHARERLQRRVEHLRSIECGLGPEEEATT